MEMLLVTERRTLEEEEWERAVEERMRKRWGGEDRAKGG